MPYFNIRIAGTLNPVQKAKIAAEITNSLQRVVRKPKSYSYIAFNAFTNVNWAIVGKLLEKE